MTVLTVVLVAICILIVTLWLLPLREFSMLPTILPLFFVPAAGVGYAVVVKLEFNPRLAKDCRWVLEFNYFVVIFSLLLLIAFFGPSGFAVSAVAFTLLKYSRSAAKRKVGTLRDQP